MVFKWKSDVDVYPVTAQTAGEELTRIYDKTGALEPKDVVEESRPESAPLHPVFEWNDEKAAEKWRTHQAGGLIRAVAVVEQPNNSKKPVEVRAFVHVQQSYHPLQVVRDDSMMRAEMLATALKELAAFQRKYENLQELSPVFKAIARTQEAAQTSLFAAY